VVLMDVQMPVLDGVAAVKQLREEEKSSGTRQPVVALTAHAMSGDREQMLECGFDGYLTKPFGLRQLVEVLGMVCPPGKREA